MGAGKGGDGGAEEAAAPEPVVLKMELHCAGCAHKVKKALKRVPGVESIVADAAANRVVVAGTADAAVLKARLEAKTSKPVEIISAGRGPKKATPAAEPKDAGAGAGEKKADKDAPPKEEKEKKQPPEEKKPKEETVLLKIRLHCDGCADRIRRRIYKIKGVKDVAMDGPRDEVKVRGTMDIPAMLSYLKEKLNRDVQAVAPGKKDGAGGGEGKGDKKDKGGDGDKNKGAAPATASGGDEKKDKGGRRGLHGGAGGAEHVPRGAAAGLRGVPAGPAAAPRRLLRVPLLRQCRWHGPRQPQRRHLLQPPVPAPAAARGQPAPGVPAVPLPLRHGAGAEYVQRREPQRLLRHVTPPRRGAPRPHPSHPSSAVAFNL